MLRRFKAIGHWLKARYGDKPTKVQVGSPPYRGTEQEVPSSTHFAMLVWRMIMEGADKTANSFFHHWKTIIFLALLIGTVLCYRPIAASIKIWGYRQEQKAALAAMEAASAQAEKAKLDEAQAKTAASAQAEKAKLDEAKAKAAASTSAQAEKDRPVDAQGDGGAKQPRAFYVSERYWVCVHKVVNCLFNNQGNQYDPNNVVKCDPAYSTTGGGFGAPHCPEGDFVQTTLVLKMPKGPEKHLVPNDVYAKHDPGTWAFLMCDLSNCDPDVVEPPLPASASAASSVSSSPPQPSAVLSHAADQRDTKPDNGIAQH